MMDEQEAAQAAAIAKFRPWFPHRMDIPLPAEPMPEMSPSEALLIIEWDRQCLYDGGSGAQSADHAMDVLRKLAGVSGLEPRAGEPEQAAKAAKWDRIAAAWETYGTGGASAFDWDYDSRDLMRELTNGAS